VARSAFVGNYAGLGGALANKGDGCLRLSNSTLADNSSAWSERNGILQNGAPFGPAGTPTLLLKDVSIAGNRNYGLVNHGRALIRNSLISGNRHSDSGDDVNCANRGDSYRYQARGLLLGNGAGNCTADLYV